MATSTGGALLARILRAEGVTTVFGIIDGTYFGFYRALRDLGITLITPRHETSAAHMAGTYARLTGQLGVCMASNGPGVANILPGLVVEESEGNRVLCITSARRSGAMYPPRTGTYQSFDQVATIGAFAKWSQMVPSHGRVAELARAALRASWEGRPGVVHLDVPENIMNSAAEIDHALWSPPQYRRTTATAPDPALVAHAADLLIDAELPIIHAGSGVIHAQAFAALRAVAERLEAPVLTSWSGRAAIDEAHPLAIPMTHVKLNHLVRNDADVVLTLGSRLGETDWWGKAPYWRLPREQRHIQVDIDGAIIGANKPADVGVYADVGAFLDALLPAVDAHLARLRPATRRARLATYRRHITRYQTKLDRALTDLRAPMNPAHVAHTVDACFPEGSVVVADGGNTAIWAMFYHRARVPGRLLSTFKMGMLGAGVAQAIGAAVATQAPVACIIGDGAMGFHPQEIETAVRHQLRVIWLVCCDRQWGMVKMNQSFALKPLKMLLTRRLAPEENIWSDLGEIRFDLVAQAMGAHGERVADPTALRGAVERALACGGPAVIHCDVNPTTHLWAPGLVHFKDMHAEPRGR
ncbi:MAG: thiamine pyrophosphate-binding protein [Gemmatimonadaceae bacterium]|nr:thiamine pyrophosphate-binding protein [Gemmatimonadaceae bacterium]